MKTLLPRDQSDSARRLFARKGSVLSALRLVGCNGHCRDERNAAPERDEFLHREKLGAVATDDRPKQLLVAEADDLVSEAVSPAERNELLVGNLLYREAMLFGLPMAGGHGRREFFGQERLDDQQFVPDRKGQIPQVDVSFQARLDDVLSEVFVDRHLGLGKLLDEPSENRRQQGRSNGRNCSEAHRASCRIVGCRPFRRIEGRQDLDCPALEPPAAIDQSHLPRRAIEDRSAEPPFPLEDLLAERRLRGQALLRHARKIAEPGDRHEIPTLVQLAGNLYRSQRNETFHF